MTRRDSTRQLKREDAAVAGDIEAAAGGEDGDEMAQSAHAITRASPSVYLVTGIAAEAVQSVIAFRAGSPDDRFRYTVCCCDNGGAPAVQPSAPSSRYSVGRYLWSPRARRCPIRRIRLGK